MDMRIAIKILLESVKPSEVQNLSMEIGRKLGKLVLRAGFDPKDWGQGSCMAFNICSTTHVSIIYTNKTSNANALCA